ncbi:hypothetical protein CYLTODRAFT_396417 [Cylindrobasidium torrendii FP15055 ss-10]|uniref:Fe2OG dioxygenase domain-containing protein n=1 Tax=Cylindrobasidium torrendii FP15055 ss-10 TaxID=1314674 RepID=A0A0D7BE16_9AGAR|nr:hypothetical protein CYLTODRAFT_396417 [Cylindrobasidium torrendii FP15055 ss-10]
MDTDTLLATVFSLLSDAHSQETVLDALLRHDGDPEAAAHFLNREARRERKRKREGGSLAEWLEPKKAKQKSSAKTSSSLNASPTKPSSSSVRPSSLSVKPSSSSIRPSSSAGSSSTKTAVKLVTLRPPPSTAPTPPRLPPLTLSTPELVATHTPCTQHLSILPPSLACTLFHTLVAASAEWKRNKWWLFDRVVESPHRTTFFARKNDGVGGSDDWQEAAQFWYNGRATGPPEVFPAEMEDACTYIEAVVNDQLRQRQRFPLEWAGTDGDASEYVWRANVAAANCYEGAKDSVGFHSDQMTYLGPYCTIASLSLGTTRTFRLREVVPTQEKDTRHAQTFNIPLPHNSLTIMHASCQERFKHSIPPQPTIDLFRPAFPPDAPPSNARINVTFRFYRPDFAPSSTPKCKCGVPCILRPDMKNRSVLGAEGGGDKYWWTCYAGAQNDGKGCNMWMVMDMEKECRGPTVGSMKSE